MPLSIVARADKPTTTSNVLNITWLANANLADTNTLGVTGINANGSLTWAKANEFLAAMNASAYLGANNWRLPDVDPINGTASGWTLTTAYNGSTDRGYHISEQGTLYAGVRPATGLSSTTL